MRLFNTVVLLFIGLPAAFFFAYQQGWLDPYVEEDWIPAGPLIQAELRATVSPQELEARIAKALEEDDYADAQLYAEIADYASIPLSDETRAALDDANSLTNNIRRTGGSFFEGFVYGRGSDTASFMGALTSDLTVIGDVRDIAGEGEKMVRGEDYSTLVLGLSVAGVAATAATVGSGGAALPTQAGLSLLKVAKKAGTLTASFASELRRLLSEAVNFKKLKETLQTTSLGDLSATRRAVGDYADNVSFAKLTPVLSDVGALQRAAGPAETIRLMRYVENSGDLARITRMSKTLGPKTRGIIELTGKTSLRAFKTLANFVLWLLSWAWAIVAGIATWLGGMGMRRGVRRLRRRRVYTREA
jgi:hypothetical protein